jgi:hypothetical protein
MNTVSKSGENITRVSTRTQNTMDHGRFENRLDTEMLFYPIGVLTVSELDLLYNIMRR